MGYIMNKWGTLGIKGNQIRSFSKHDELISDSHHALVFSYTFSCGKGFCGVFGSKRIVLFLKKADADDLVIYIFAVVNSAD